MPNSMARFAEISPFWQNFKSLGHFSIAIFSIWQNVENTLEKYECYWASLHYCKWQNIEQII